MPRLPHRDSGRNGSRRVWSLVSCEKINHTFLAAYLQAMKVGENNLCKTSSPMAPSADLALTPMTVPRTDLRLQGEGLSKLLARYPPPT